MNTSMGFGSILGFPHIWCTTIRAGKLWHGMVRIDKRRGSQLLQPKAFSAMSCHRLRRCWFSIREIEKDFFVLPLPFPPLPLLSSLAVRSPAPTYAPTIIHLHIFTTSTIQWDFINRSMIDKFWCHERREWKWHFAGIVVWYPSKQ